MVVYIDCVVTRRRLNWWQWRPWRWVANVHTLNVGDGTRGAKGSTRRIFGPGTRQQVTEQAAQHIVWLREAYEDMGVQVRMGRP